MPWTEQKTLFKSAYGGKPILKIQIIMKNCQKTIVINKTFASFSNCKISDEQTKELKGGIIGTEDVLDL